MPHDEATGEAAIDDALVSPPARPESLTEPSRAQRQGAGAASTAAPTSDVIRAYLDHSAIGYIIYAVGALTAFLAVALALSDGQAGLHSSALAIGMVGAGFGATTLDRLVGQRLGHMLAPGLLIIASLLLAWAPSFGITLAAALLVGLGCGVMLSHINRTLTSAGGSRARVQMSRSTLISMLTSVTVPLVIGIGIALGIGWRFSLLPAVVLASLAIVSARGRIGNPADAVVTRARLPGSYWLAWFLVVLVVAVEFAIVFWGSSLVERRAGVTLGEATLTISAFIGGMIAGRVALSFHAVGDRDPIWLMRGGIALAGFGAILAWATASYELGGLGLLLAGMGVGMLYPIGAALTIAAAPGREGVGAGRLVMASGSALLLAPLILGVAADMTDVVAAWLLVPLLCLAALALTVPVSRTRGPHRVDPSS